MPKHVLTFHRPDKAPIRASGDTLIEAGTELGQLLANLPRQERINERHPLNLLFAAVLTVAGGQSEYAHDDTQDGHGFTLCHTTESLFMLKMNEGEELVARYDPDHGVVRIARRPQDAMTFTSHEEAAKWGRRYAGNNSGLRTWEVVPALA